MPKGQSHTPLDKLQRENQAKSFEITANYIFLYRQFPTTPVISLFKDPNFPNATKNPLAYGL